MTLIQVHEFIVDFICIHPTSQPQNNQNTKYSHLIWICRTILFACSYPCMYNVHKGVHTTCVMCIRIMYDLFWNPALPRFVFFYSHRITRPPPFQTWYYDFSKRAQRCLWNFKNFQILFCLCPPPRVTHGFPKKCQPIWSSRLTIYSEHIKIYIYIYFVILL